MESASRLHISRPFHRLICKSRHQPSTKVLGYFHLVRFADETTSDSLRKAIGRFQGDFYPLLFDFDLSGSTIICDRYNSAGH
jgi:hypothetical protein